MTNQEVRQLEPQILWNHFADLNAVPRPSKKEERVVEFMVNFAKDLGLEVVLDKVQNVIIRKPATAGFENRKPIVLQSHLDMVHQKNADTVFNFDKQGIEMMIEEDWVTANGTTLGADNGLGVAAIMAILSSKDIEHPHIEALFTIDEETGMTGAKGLEPGFLNGSILLNLDTEEDDEIDIGCAGGVDVTATQNYIEENTSGQKAFKISLTGLQGGHSGMDINKGLGNANKLMNQVLQATRKLIRISSIEGGSLRNAIPRESFAVVVCDTKNASKFIEIANKEIDLIKEQFESIEPQLKFTFESVEDPYKIIPLKTQDFLIDAVAQAHNGVYKMSTDIPDLVEASNNIAKIVVANGKIKISCLTRSSIESSKDEVSHGLKSVFEKNGFEVVLSGDYPGWEPNPNSAILKVMENLYQKIFLKAPKIVACHAGLECGIIGTHYPDMDMISFGPTIKGAHSPDEKVSISSVQKFWAYLLETLKNIPLMN